MSENRMRGTAEDILLKSDLADYPIEIGEKDGWRYKVWKSGEAECWGKFKYYSHEPYESLPPSNSMEATYLHKDQVNFPVGFAKSPCVSVTGRCENGLAHPVRVAVGVDSIEWNLQTNENYADLTVHIILKGSLK